MTNLFESQEMRTALSTRVDRLTAEHKNSLRKAVEDSYQLVEGLWGNPDSYISSMDGMNYFYEKNKAYILNPSFDLTFRIQSLRMLADMEKEFTAAVIGVTRKTYAKLESEAFIDGLEESALQNLLDKTRGKLYTLGENPKYAELWIYFIYPQKNKKTYLCANNHKYDSDYPYCPTCDLLDLETGYEPTETKDELGDYEFFRESLESVSEKHLPNLGKLVKKRSEDLYEKENSQATSFIWHLEKDDENKDISVLRQQREIIDKNIKDTNQEIIELLVKSKYLLHRMYKNALPDTLFKKYLENPDRHRDTVNDYLKEAGLESSEYFDEKNQEILETMSYIMFLPNENW